MYVRHYLRTRDRSRDKTSPVLEEPPTRSLHCQELILPCPLPPPPAPSLPLPPLPIVAPSALEAGILPQSCLETSQMPETFLTPTLPFRDLKADQDLGHGFRKFKSIIVFCFLFFFRYIKVTLWAVVNQRSICNMEKECGDKSRGSIATKLGFKSPFQDLRAAYSNLTVLV